MQDLRKMLVEGDLSLVEVNPFIIDTQGDLLCLDAKVVVDDNALFRQSKLRAMRDPSQEDPRESHAMPEIGN